MNEWQPILARAAAISPPMLVQSYPGAFAGLYERVAADPCVPDSFRAPDHRSQTAGRHRPRGYWRGWLSEPFPGAVPIAGEGPAVTGTGCSSIWE